MPDMERGCLVRCLTSPETVAVAFAMNARVAALCRDLSYDCNRYLSLDLLTTDEAGRLAGAARRGSASGRESSPSP